MAHTVCFKNSEDARLAVEQCNARSQAEFADQQKAQLAVSAGLGTATTEAPSGLDFLERIARKAVAGFYVSKTEVQIMAAFLLGAAVSE